MSPPGKSLSTSPSPDDLELQPILTGQNHLNKDHSKTARGRQLLRDPVTRAALGNLALILTWYLVDIPLCSLHCVYLLQLDKPTVVCRYFFSTLLSLWNRKLVGEGHGVFGKGAFPGHVLTQLVLDVNVCIACQHFIMVINCASEQMCHEHPAVM